MGKSTLCQGISKKLDVSYYSAGDLISAINGERYGANKVVADKHSNQKKLKLQVERLLMNNQRILLAGHFCIFDENNNVDYLPEKVFDDLQIEGIILLEAEVFEIIENLQERDNKSYTQKEISTLQKAERERAILVSGKLGVKLFLYKMSFDGTDVQNCLNYIQGVLI